MDVIRARLGDPPPALGQGSAASQYVSLIPRALEISSQTRSAYYDCLYVALAERENGELVTDDDRLVRNLQALFPFVIHLSALP
jgi:hypothetical protein